jgi:hypothetical protein
LFSNDFTIRKPPISADEFERLFAVTVSNLLQIDHARAQSPLSHCSSLGLHPCQLNGICGQSSTGTDFPLSSSFFPAHTIPPLLHIQVRIIWSSDSQTVVHGSLQMVLEEKALQKLYQTLNK